MLRFMDLLLSLVGLIVSSPLLLTIYIIIFFDQGKPIFRQERVGRFQKPFIIVKFRTMSINTASVASHLVDASAVTALGRVLRRTKIDELPQLWNVLVGEMSLVGPRPCLFNQTELIRERSSLGIFNARPGITGLGQVRKIDMSMPKLLAETELIMLQEMSMVSYFKYIFITFGGGGSGDVVRPK